MLFLPQIIHMRSREALNLSLTVSLRKVASIGKAPLFINEPWLIDKYLFDYSDRIKEPENTEYL